MPPLQSGMGHGKSAESEVRIAMGCGIIAGFEVRIGMAIGRTVEFGVRIGMRIGRNAEFGVRISQGLRACEHLMVSWWRWPVSGQSQSKYLGRESSRGVQTETALPAATQAALEAEPWKRLLPRALAPPAARLWGERHWERRADRD